jgi:riboflavin kinase/FMN adenylyltransferase
MNTIRDLSQANIQRDTVLAIGAFDGLHLGHQELLRRLILRARQTDRASGMVTFDPLPRTVLNPSSNTVCLTSAQDKAELLAAWGLDLLAILPFTPALAHMAARDFVHILCEHLRMSELWIGPDFALGRGRTGNGRVLSRLGQTMGFAVHVIEPITDGTAVISSTQIRQLIVAGRVREASEMLGRYHHLTGIVIRGTGRGRQLGFPTANLQVPKHCAVPADGVYAVYVVHRDRRHRGVANIGYRPTFEEGQYGIEVHLLGFAQDLYGEEVRLLFVERLRGERRFSSAHALCAQVEKDRRQAQEILS